ncbi:MAG: DNA polymerase III subunit gamma/tau [Candidatus Azobacteroides sp.]|nr:DNA polymerase III subunit gamma/tau [Candidatus Azobacteroides sp.]
MDNYIVSARKYRPSTFRSVVGQKSLTTTLKNAIASNKLAHAYLFCGPRGVGKTTCARIFAKTINCLNLTAEGEACNECESCVAFNEQRSYNIHELDAASNNSVDDIRSLVEQVRIPPQIGQYKVYIIDEVHMLSSGAFNAFLKTLEEPPKHAIFILATTEKHKILPTILSRCQIYDFKRINVNDTIEHLQYVASQENVTVEPEALMVIAQKADGGMRDALSIFDQVVSFTNGNVTYNAVIENLNVLDYEYYFRLTDAILKQSVAESLLLFDEVLSKGFEGYHFITGLSSHFRDLMVCKDEVTLVLLEVSAGIREKYKIQAKNCSNPFLYKALEITNETELNYRQSKNKRLLIELALIRLCQVTGTPADNNPEKKNTIEKIPVEDIPAGKASSTGAGNITGNVSPQVVQPSGNHTPQQFQTVPEPSQASQKPAPEMPVSPDISSQTPSAPQQAPPKTVSARPVGRTRPSTISLKNNGQEETKKEEAEQTVIREVLATPFTETQIIQGWQEYMNRLPSDRILMKQTMEQCVPTKISDSQYEVIAYNRNQVKDLTDEMIPIRLFLNKVLQNNQFTISIRERENQENRKAFSKSEQFTMMQEKNPYLTELKDLFGLEID